MMPAEGSWYKNIINEPLWIAVLSAILCILSMVGSSAIILAYAIVKKVRSKPRELLVHLSAMDLMYSTSNLIGLLLPYNKNLKDTNMGTSTYSTYHGLCIAQAFIAVYGTIGSVLWTLGLAVYLYYRIVSRDNALIKRVVIALYISCYSLPLYATVWLLVKKGLGYSDNPLSGGGWCSISDSIDPLENFMANDIWIWLGIIILIPLYFLIHIEINYVKKYHSDGDHVMFSRLHNPVRVEIESRLLLVPVVFIFLRVWDLLSSIIFVYHPSPALQRNNHWLQPLTAIGDCGQGFFNFIIFFVFQPKMRKLFCCFCCKRASQWWAMYSKGDDYYYAARPLDESSTEPLGLVNEDNINI